MGASSSKAARGAGRKFPTRAPGAAPPPTARPAGPSVVASQARTRPPPPPQEHAPASHSDSLDPSDVTPELSARLRQMPIAEPHPTFSPSSRAGFPPSLGPDPSLARPSAAPTQSPGGAPVYPSASRNTTLSALEARRAIEARADEEFENLGRAGSTGRELLDLNTIVQMHLLREKGVSDQQIEERFNLKPGTVRKLGRKGITVPASAQDQS